MKDSPIQKINQDIQAMMNDELGDPNLISGGFHTFGELYNHRFHLLIALCKSLNKNYTIIKSRLHHDGEGFDGHFIVQIEHKHTGQISYHLPNKYWGKLDFIQTVDRANEWDGHSSDEVLERLLKI